jgi:hypothetical protein
MEQGRTLMVALTTVVSGSKDLGAIDPSPRNWPRIGLLEEVEQGQRLGIEAFAHCASRLVIKGGTEFQ